MTEKLHKLYQPQIEFDIAISLPDQQEIRAPDAPGGRCSSASSKMSGYSRGPAQMLLHSYLLSTL